ncbi:hypothetical protein M422DRAFT_254912 [Sphaerobolus stellatus SS14]|uniref:Unplaced genomic scaffold SPHSTscaffold_58, whole genome shotgun sequence n=1 Tax=Sphaerobolus stellatus (strain SS14) TaxID=990650 RepID=A0A0C9VUI7_SPHS4|nr:hypothetical protein M422DRAFT_254912 [Sphaerobolus stellatus SS14]
MAQAYLLMASYGLPARRWEEDRSWFYGGLAGRIATDLNLNMTPTSFQLDELDKTADTVQFGKPTGLEEDETVRGAKVWYRSVINKASWAGNHDKQPQEGETEGRGDKYDVHLVTFTELLMIMTWFHERVGGPGAKRDLRVATEATEAELQAWRDAADWSYEHESDKNASSAQGGLPLFENYMRLVMYSFGFEDTWKRRKGSGAELGDIMFIAKVLNPPRSAKAVVKQLCDVHTPSGYLKYAPNCYFVMGGFCAAFMLKMLRSEFSSLLEPTQRERIISLVQRFVEMLASPVASIDETHTPMLYAKFLHGQVKHVLTAEKEAQAKLVAQQRQQQEAQNQLQLQSHYQGEVPKFEEPEQVQDNLSDSDTRSTSCQLTDPSTPPGQSYYSSDHSASGAGSVVHTPDLTQWDFAVFPSSANAGDASTDGGVEGGAEGQGVDNMDLCEGDYLATMQAVSNEQWMNTMLMPGFKWFGEDVVMADDITTNVFGMGGGEQETVMAQQAMNAGADVNAMWGYGAPAY